MAERSTAGASQFSNQKDATPVGCRCPVSEWYDSAKSADAMITQLRS